MEIAPIFPASHLIITLFLIAENTLFSQVKQSEFSNIKKLPAFAAEVVNCLIPGLSRCIWPGTECAVFCGMQHAAGIKKSLFWNFFIPSFTESLSQFGLMSPRFPPLQNSSFSLGYQHFIFLFGLGHSWHLSHEARHSTSKTIM